MLALVVLGAVVIVGTAVGVLVALGVGHRARPRRAESGDAPVAEPAGGPYLHWIPDRRGGWRLAGEFVPEATPPPSLPRGGVRGRRRRPR